ncbi:MAG: hypothetical protein V4750_17680 [Pseudomonadota bacterium]
MTTTHPIEPNPFALMMNPEAVLAAVAGSDRLARLKSRICRPLDKPTIARADGDAGAFEDAADATPVQENAEG